jgi:hypothetical protein
LNIASPQLGPIAAPCNAACAARLLAASDTRARWLDRIAAAERRGYARGEAAADARWDAGYAAAIAEVKAAQHGLYAVFSDRAEAERRMWGPRGRAHFADPQPGDYMGGPVEWQPATPVRARRGA